MSRIRPKVQQTFFTLRNEDELPVPPLPDPALLDGSSWDRRHYDDDMYRRIKIRGWNLLRSLGIEVHIFDLAQQLERQRDAFIKAEALLKDPRFAQALQGQVDIQREETEVSRAWLARQQLCKNCKVTPMSFDLDGHCEECHRTVPSTPPPRGIKSALARARRAKVAATLTRVQWHRTVKHFNNRCAYCEGPWCVVEHATPIPRGGTTFDNCIPACESCNNTKKGLTIEELEPSPCVVVALSWLKSCGRPIL